MNPSSTNEASDEIKKSLFANANESNWIEVIKTYEQNSSSHTAKITSSGDTALHIAVSNGEESFVEQLVAAASKTPAALEMKNELGNTPLHLAAYLGNARMCSCIAGKDTTLMGIRNDDKETPFFLAVRHGRKEAFRALHKICGPVEGEKYCRGKDGETILHAAISGEYFDLAFEIMGHYERLLNAINEQGFSPLHLLANKPSAFRSGSHIRGLQRLIYHCIFIDELQLNTMNTQAADFQYNAGVEKYPKNYGTCVAAFNLISHVTRVLLGHNSKVNQDEENIKDKKEPETPKEHQQNEKHPNGLVNKLKNVLCGNRLANAERHQFEDGKQAGASIKRSAHGHELLPKNCNTFFNFVKLLSKATLVILGLGSKSVEKMREKKAKHIWSLQIMEKLLEHASYYEYENNGKSPVINGKQTFYSIPSSADEDIAQDNAPKQSDRKVGTTLEMEKRETPILIAAKGGVVEMVSGILRTFPVAIHDMNNEKKNVVLLAVEHRQPHVYKFLLDRKAMQDTVFRKTDKDGNSALHLAARLGEYKPWLIPGAALQMQWEIKWYEFVKDSVAPHFFPRYNNESKTPRDIFSDTHTELAKEGGEWLTNTSQSCSVVATLIATVAFATSATVPGGVKSDNSGTPTLQNEPAFAIFAISSLVALYSSVSSVIMFLAILTSRFQVNDYVRELPRKLMIGLTSLFISIGSMLLSFSAGHFFVLKEKLHHAAFPVYALTCLPTTYFAVAQFPLYFELVVATIRKMPQRSAK